MDKDELIKELTDPQAIQNSFFEYLTELLSYKATQSDAVLDGESPEYAEYLTGLQRILDRVATEPEHKQIINFILQLNLIFFRMMAENNQKLLSLAKLHD